MKKVLKRVKEMWRFYLCTFWDEHTYIEQKVTENTSNYYCKYCGDGYGVTSFKFPAIVITKEEKK